MGCQMLFYNPEQCLVLINSIFISIVSVKMGCHFNNSMFFIKNIIKFVKYKMEYSR